MVTKQEVDGLGLKHGDRIELGVYGANRLRYYGAHGPNNMNVYGEMSSGGMGLSTEIYPLDEIADIKKLPM